MTAVDTLVIVTVVSVTEQIDVIAIVVVAPAANEEDADVDGEEVIDINELEEEVTDKDFIIGDQPNHRGLDEATEEERPKMIIDLLSKKQL